MRLGLIPDPTGAGRKEQIKMDEKEGEKMKGYLLGGEGSIGEMLIGENEPWE